MKRHRTKNGRKRSVRGFLSCCVTAGVMLGTAEAQTSYSPTGTILSTSGYGLTNTYFGRSAGLFKDWALIGAAGIDGTPGEAHMYELDGGTWSPRAYLDPSPLLATPESFGTAVALGAGVALVGAPGEDSSTGQVVVFEEQGGAWIPRQVLSSRQARPGDRFGVSVALVGGLAIVGAEGLEQVEVFYRSGRAWQWKETLSVGQAELFGSALAYDGTQLVVGAPGEKSAFVFTRPALKGGQAGNNALASVSKNSSFVFRAKLTPWLSNRKEKFGSSIAVSGEKILIGAPDDDNAMGAAYLFEKSAAGWAPEQAFVDSGQNGPTSFGNSVAMTTNEVLIGSPGDDVVFGSVFVYGERQGTWDLIATLDSPIYGVEGRFGVYVAAYGEEVLTSIGLDDTLPFGFYGGALLVWRADQVRAPYGELDASTSTAR